MQIAFIVALLVGIFSLSTFAVKKNFSSFVVLMLAVMVIGFVVVHSA